MSRTLPLFPLRLVLFPDATVPLHIFEPRYRQMLHDCLATDRRFGLILAPDEPEEPLDGGRVGCIARVESVDPLGDGRSNILVVGEARFAVDRLSDIDTPYLVAAVTLVDDLPEEPAANQPLADAVRARFERAARAARVLGNDQAPIPELAGDPATLAFHVAALVDFDLDERQALLASRSPRERLLRVQALLDAALPSLESRAALHRRARTNGHGPHGDA
ncbi:MAG: LON peptidase substrate-binding domain-containing protein [Gemmatimonadaceae bacterium]|nr:LON peptidase substrate-binding domain-containing protein [Gemmatimonadaceae bacterium]